MVRLCANSSAIAAAYFLLLELRDEDLAFCGYLFFTLHPLHVEAVVWVAVLPDLICGLLLFLAVLAFFAAALTKEGALPFPAALLLYESIYRRSQVLRRIETCFAAPTLQSTNRTKRSLAPGRRYV